jgi:hypothetical protein
MASRVTRWANSACDKFSVPAGRLGKTKYRTSAVESQTRMRVLLGNVTPKSAKTLRGSKTARDR